MSRRKNAPYKDAIEPGGLSLRYEGHDIPKNKACPNPKIVDQLRKSPGGSLTQNGLFEKAALATKKGLQPAEIIAVYEKSIVEFGLSMVFFALPIAHFSPMALERCFNSGLSWLTRILNYLPKEILTFRKHD